LPDHVAYVAEFGVGVKKEMKQKEEKGMRSEKEGTRPLGGGRQYRN